MLLLLRRLALRPTLRLVLPLLPPAPSQPVAERCRVPPPPGHALPALHSAAGCGSPSPGEVGSACVYRATWRGYRIMYGAGYGGAAKEMEKYTRLQCCRGMRGSEWARHACLGATVPFVGSPQCPRLRWRPGQLSRSAAETHCETAPQPRPPPHDAPCGTDTHAHPTANQSTSKEWGDLHVQLACAVVILFVASGTSMRLNGGTP